MPFTHLLTNGVIWLIMLITEDKLPIFFLNPSFFVETHFSTCRMLIRNPENGF